MSRRLQQVSARVLPQLEAFYRTPRTWQRAPHASTLCTWATPAVAYTWVDPQVHSVIDAADATYQGWLGVEMTLHEASHGLTDPLIAALENAGRAAKKDAGALWTPCSSSWSAKS